MNNTQPLSPSDAECIDLAAPFYERSEHGVKLNVPALVRALLASAKQTTDLERRGARFGLVESHEHSGLGFHVRTGNKLPAVGSLVHWPYDAAPAPSLPSDAQRPKEIGS